MEIVENKLNFYINITPAFKSVPYPTTKGYNDYLLAKCKPALESDTMKGYIDFLRANSDELAMDSITSVLLLWSDESKEIISGLSASGFTYDGYVLKYTVKFMASIPKLLEYCHQKLDYIYPVRDEDGNYKGDDGSLDEGLINATEPTAENLKMVLAALSQGMVIGNEYNGGYVITDNDIGSASRLNIVKYMKDHEDLDNFDALLDEITVNVGLVSN